MNKVLHESRYFKLTEIRHRKQKKDSRNPIYEIKWHDVLGCGYGYGEEIRNIVDPLRNIGGDRGKRWCFKDLKTAEKKYMILTLRWA